MGLSNYFLNFNLNIKRLYSDYFYIVCKNFLKYDFKLNLFNLKIIKIIIRSFVKKDFLFIKKNN
jgi:hypothetical protein